jgi:TolB protein
LTSNPADDTHPDWSPDERNIVFVSDRDGNRELYVMKADGSDVRRLTADPAVDDWPAWASNVRLHGGSEIAFESNRNRNLDIYSILPDGSDRRRLTDDPNRDFAPAWAPDGMRIAFVSDRDGADDEIYVMNADGTGQTRLTESPGEDGAPAWSHDGQRITFTSERDGHRARYSMNSDGSAQMATATPP